MNNLIITHSIDSTIETIKTLRFSKGCTKINVSGEVNSRQVFFYELTKVEYKPNRFRHYITMKFMYAGKMRSSCFSASSHKKFLKKYESLVDARVKQAFDKSNHEVTI